MVSDAKWNVIVLAMSRVITKMQDCVLAVGREAPAGEEALDVTV